VYAGCTRHPHIACGPESNLFRRRGVASVLTGEAVHAAFLQGVEVALLTAADGHAAHLYERLGFRPYATLLASGDDVK
jgi:ribosomal protein S18 acetylase RimI-like enzyme